MTQPHATLHSIGAGHWEGELRDHPGGLVVYLMHHTADEANLGLWRPADAPYTHKSIVGGGLLKRAPGGPWSGTVTEGKATWVVSGTTRRLEFAEQAP